MWNSLPWYVRWAVTLVAVAILAIAALWVVSLLLWLVFSILSLFRPPELKKPLPRPSPPWRAPRFNYFALTREEKRRRTLGYDR